MLEGDWVEFGQEERLTVRVFVPVPSPAQGSAPVNRPRPRSCLAAGSEDKVLRLSAPNHQALIDHGLRPISFASPLPVKDQLLIAPVRATGRHGMVCQTVLNSLSVAVIV